MNEISDLEYVFLIVGVSRPKPARLIGESTGKHIFEPLKANFSQYKKCGKLIFVRNFDILDLKIEDKKVLIIK